MQCSRPEAPEFLWSGLPISRVEITNDWKSEMSTSFDQFLSDYDDQVQSLLNEALALFTHISYGFTAFLVLLLLAVVSTIVIYLRARRVQKQIEQAGVLLDEIRDEEDFTSNFSRVNADLVKVPAISRLWEEFTETLLPPLEEIDDPEYRVYRNTKRPQTFFTSTAILSDVRPIIESERLIGLGLVLTFLGLVAALGQAAEGFQGGGDDIKDALEKLLSTAGAKFLASVGGLGGALFQTMFQGLIARSSIRDLDRFNDNLERLLSFASQERIAADHFGYAKRQTARLEEMSTEITMALGKQIEEALSQIPDKFSIALEPIQQSFEKVTEKLSAGSTDALQQLVTDFQNQLTGASDQSMNNVVSQLEVLSSTLDATVIGMRTSNDELRSGLSDVLASLESSSNTFQQGVNDSANAASSQLAKMVESLGSQQAQTASAITTLIDELKHTSASVNEDMRGTATQQMENLAGGIQAAVARIIDNAESSSSALTNQISETLHEVSAQTTRNVSAILEGTSTRVDEAVMRVTSAIDEWREVTELTNRSLRETNSELGRHNQGLKIAGSQITEAGEVFSLASDDVKTATQPLRTLVEGMASATNELVRFTSQIGNEVNRTSENMLQAVTSISESVKDLKAAWDMHSDHLLGADEQLENAFRQVTDNLHQSLATISDYNFKFSDKVGEALDNLGSLVSELGDEVSELNSKK